MADLRNVVIVTYTPVRDAAELHGRVIGNIYGNYVPFQCSVDYGQMHDKWVPLVNPSTWKDTGRVGWVEWSHCVESVGDPDKVQILVTYYKDGRVEAKVVG